MVLRYEVWLTEMLAVATLAMAIPICLVDTSPRHLLNVWIYLFVGNYVITRFSFPRLLKTAAWAGLDKAAGKQG